MMIIYDDGTGPLAIVVFVFNPTLIISVVIDPEKSNSIRNQQRQFVRTPIDNAQLDFPQSEKRKSRTAVT